MARTKHTSEQIIQKLREADIVRGRDSLWTEREGQNGARSDPQIRD